MEGVIAVRGNTDRSSYLLSVSSLSSVAFETTSESSRLGQIISVER